MNANTQARINNAVTFASENIHWGTFNAIEEALKKYGLGDEYFDIVANALGCIGLINK